MGLTKGDRIGDVTTIEVTVTRGSTVLVKCHQSNSSQNCSMDCFDFNLQVGTLDVLVGLSDELGKVDTYCER